MLLSEQILPKKEGKLQKKKNEREIVLVKSTHVKRLLKRSQVSAAKLS